MQKLGNSSVYLENIKVLNKSDETMVEMDIRVRDLENLNNFIRDLKSMKYVNDVERVLK